MYSGLSTLDNQLLSEGRRCGALEAHKRIKLDLCSMIKDCRALGAHDHELEVKEMGSKTAADVARPFYGDTRGGT